MGRKLAIGLVVVVVIGAGLVVSGGKIHLRLGEHHAGGIYKTHHKGRSDPRTIVVTGAGAVLAAPDTATLSIGVDTFSVESDKALSENNQRMARVIDGLKSMGLSTDEIQTSGFSLRRVVDKEETGPGREDGFIGYRVRNSVRLHTKQIELIELLMEQAVGWGATEISSLRFLIEDDSRYLAIAREYAVKDATKYAQQLVDASGASLGEVLRIDDSRDRYSRRRAPVGIRSDVLGEDVPVFLSTETVYASVNVTFRIE